jgi:putative two-component system response regulator
MTEQNNFEKDTILIVDDIPENIDILYGILKQDYNVKVALNAEDAFSVVYSKNPPDLILLDVMMPGMDGYEVCKRLKENKDSKNIPVIFITAKGEESDERKGFMLGGVDYITKPVKPLIVKARVKTQLTLKNQNRILEEKVAERTNDLNNALKKIKTVSLETIHRLTNASEYKDQETGDHIKRMSNYTVEIAREMGVNENSIEQLLYAAPMHDIGKIGVPDHILLKPGPLDDDEWEIMKKHTEIGAKILEGSSSGFIKLGELIALTHHEKWDGTGYPGGLKGEEIPFESRIVAIADVFDALTSKRPYKEPFSIEKSFKIISEGRGSHFDPDVVDAFFRIKDIILKIKDRYQDKDESVYLKIAKLTEKK